jgi:hypothetical protein
MKRREFLAAGIGLSLALPKTTLAQKDVATRSAKTSRLFKSPGLYPNALAVMTDDPGGLWIGQQKVTPQSAQTYGLPLDPNQDEAAWLVDWNGKLLKTVKTHSRNTSGMAYGGGCVWMGANADPFGIFQVKLWIAALRLGGILRVDPETWVPEVLIRVSSDERPRLHDVAFDDEDNIWVVTGNNSTGYTDGKAGLNKYDGKTGQRLMTVEFEPGSCDPHGLVWHEGRLISCDAGIHPGWKGMESPHSGYIFRIEIA